MHIALSYTQESLSSLDAQLQAAASLPDTDPRSKGFLHSSVGPSLGPLTYDADFTGNAAKLHADPALAGSVFQVASQFNVLEMVSPDVGPDAGVTGYVHDRTQGPACAMSCPAATVFRFTARASCAASSLPHAAAPHVPRLIFTPSTTLAHPAAASSCPGTTLYLQPAV